MSNLISVLALLVIVVPLAVSVLISGPDNLLTACSHFFHQLLDQATRFGTS
ncbi:hypothetical protein ACI7RC_23580 [Brevibacillus sp. B_LB10_24]|uniref:hypothetical protein n=1 Tax=Brevibacillus sp. B_LB10_24 TaxID=3380645 RepID=UPI0038BDCAFD